MVDVILNADDFGLSRGVNYGVLDSHLNGVVSATTMLVNVPATEHAVELAKANPSLRIGVHLALTIGRPILDNVSSLTEANGAFRKLAKQRNEAFVDPEDVIREWSAQIDRFLAFGLKPSHLDSHHHMHSWAHIRPAVEALSFKYNLPWRNVFEERPTGITLLTEAFDARFYQAGVTESMLDKIIAEHQHVDSLEIMCHPAYVDHALKKQSSYVDERVLEAEVLTTYRLPKGTIRL